MNIGKSVGVLLAVVLLLGSSSLAYGKPKAVERLGIDPVLHGIWYAHMTSQNGGKAKAINPPEAMCKVGASKVTMEGGDTYKVLKVMITEDKKGQTANVILFDNSAMWAVTKIPKQPYYLVQVFGNDKEIARFMVSVR